MDRPNILILYTDQQRWDALGVNGNPDIITPNLDRLAGQGVNFDHFFVQNPVCMPSRLSFLTGQYPSTLRITHMGVPVPEDTLTIAHLLDQYGYFSANIGKLHFLPHANRDHTMPHPLYGFDQLEISDEPGVYEDAYRAWVRRLAPEQLELVSAGLPPNTAVWYQTMRIQDPVQHPITEPRPSLRRAIPFAAAEHLTHTAFVADQTMSFLRRQQGTQPFLCIAGFYSPHSPWIAPQRYLDMYDPQQLPIPQFPPHLESRRREGFFSDAELRSVRQGYYAMITEVDHYVGRILDTLEQQGLAENTIVVFTSDHGEWLGEHLRYGKGYPGADAVSRVPLIVRWPAGHLPTGQTLDYLVEGVDVLPTLLEWAGIQPPPHLNGRSFAPLLEGRPYQARASALLEHTGWKALRTRNFRYVVHADGTEHLWDLDRDPAEYADVAGEADMQSVLAEHRSLLLQHLISAERPLPRTWTY